MTIDYFTGDKIAEPGDFGLPPIEARVPEVHPSLREFYESATLAIERFGFAAYINGPEHNMVDWRFSLNGRVRTAGITRPQLIALHEYGGRILDNIISKAPYIPRNVRPGMKVIAPPFAKMTAEQEADLAELADPDFILPGKALLDDYLTDGEYFDESKYEPTSPLHPLNDVSMQLARMIARPASTDLQVAVGIAYCEVRGLYTTGERTDGVTPQEYAPGTAAKLLVEFVRLPDSSPEKLVESLVDRTGLDAGQIIDSIPFALCLPDLAEATRKTGDMMANAGFRIVKQELQIARDEILVLVQLGREMLESGIFAPGSPEEQFMQAEINDLYGLYNTILERMVGELQLGSRRELGLKTLGRSALSLTGAQKDDASSEKVKKRRKGADEPTAATGDSPEQKAAIQTLTALQKPHIQSRNQARKLPFYNKMHLAMGTADKGTPYIIDASSAADFVAVCKILAQLHTDREAMEGDDHEQQNEYMVNWFAACSEEERILAEYGLSPKIGFLHLTRNWLITENGRLTDESEPSYIPEVAALSEWVTSHYRKTT